MYIFRPQEKYSKWWTEVWFNLQGCRATGLYSETFLNDIPNIQHLHFLGWNISSERKANKTLRELLCLCAFTHSCVWGKGRRTARGQSFEVQGWDTCVWAPPRCFSSPSPPPCILHWEIRGDGKQTEDMTNHRGDTVQKRSLEENGEEEDGGGKAF